MAAGRSEAKISRKKFPGLITHVEPSDSKYTEKDERPFFAVLPSASVGLWTTPIVRSCLKSTSTMDPARGAVVPAAIGSYLAAVRIVSLQAMYGPASTNNSEDTDVRFEQIKCARIKEGHG
eukprot:COSAG01_NODE_1953_length_8818_cov_5.158619_4_plen_121_part_00